MVSVMSNFDLDVDDLTLSTKGNVAYLSNEYTSLKVFFDYEDKTVSVHRESDVQAILYTDGTDESEILSPVTLPKELMFAIERTINTLFEIIEERKRKAFIINRMFDELNSAETIAQNMVSNYER